MTTATFEENCSTITVDEGNMMRLYTDIDNDMRGYIWGGCDLPSEYEPYREAISDAVGTPSKKKLIECAVKPRPSGLGI